MPAQQHDRRSGAIEERADPRLDDRLDADALAAIADAEDEAPDPAGFGLRVPAPLGEMAIRATNLGVRYNLNFTKRTKLRTTFATLLDPRRRSKGHFWALRGVDFTVHRGEAVGIVGPNGSGKSTMLLALAGILQPSEGMVEVNGHVSTLLSLQAGFDAELSGRENIALAGALMGIDHKVMQALTPGIIDFANIGAFIDAPMKTYSSGMRARVGFSIATAVDPDILLLDEVLQTGDNTFKEKSRKRIAEVLQTAKAVVMVTHDMSWITAFCTRAILLDKGRIVAEGDPEDIADLHEQDAERRKKRKRKAKQLVKHGKVDLVDVRKARRTGTLDEVLEGNEHTAAQLEQDSVERKRRKRKAKAAVAAAGVGDGGAIVDDARAAVDDDARAAEGDARAAVDDDGRAAAAPVDTIDAAGPAAVNAEPTSAGVRDASAASRDGSTPAPGGDRVEPLVGVERTDPASSTDPKSRTDGAAASPSAGAAVRLSDDEAAAARAHAGSTEASRAPAAMGKTEHPSSEPEPTPSGSAHRPE